MNAPFCPFVKQTDVGLLVKDPTLTDRQRLKMIATALWGENFRSAAAKNLGIVPGTIETWLGEKATLSGPWHSRVKRFGPPPPPEAICDLIKVARQRIRMLQATIELIRLQPWIDG